MQFEAFTITVVVSLLALVLAAYAIYKRPSGKVITPELIVSELKTAAPMATEIVNVVTAGVFAAEQLKLTGRLPDNNAAFDYALKHAKKLLPDLDEETLTTYIESAVFAAKRLAGKGTVNIVTTENSGTDVPSGPVIKTGMKPTITETGLV